MQTLHTIQAMAHTKLTPSTLDTTRTDDLRIGAVRPLITPALLAERLPIKDASAQQIAQQRSALVDIVHGRDDRLVVVVGPCSIHDHDQAIAYAQQLQQLAAQYQDELFVVMRVYFEKPRTTVGWKGYINDPHLDGSFAINAGLERARKLLLEIVELGLPTGTEFLDLLSPQFISDLIVWGAIGARTTESQSHRQLISGISCPVGFKNGTDGRINVAVDAVVAAQSAHAFMGMTKMGQAAIFETRGNHDCHIILRGGKTPNYQAHDIEQACQVLHNSGQKTHVMVDLSHANSNKEHTRQLDVAADVANQIANGSSSIMGVMIESNLHEGKQSLGTEPLQYGVSITDACISIQQTEPIFEQLAQAIRTRRAKSG